MKAKWRFSMSLALTGSLLLSSVSVAFAVDANTDAKSKTDSASGYYFVQLEDDPVATYTGDVKGFKATKTAPNKKLDPNTSDVKNYQSYLSQKRNALKQWMKLKAKSSKVVTEYSLSFNGVGIKASPEDAKKIAQAPGVEKVVVSKQYRPAMNRSHEIINNLPLWNLGYKGEGMKVAVIDSGVDNKHPFLTDSSLPMPEGFPKVQVGLDGETPMTEWAEKYTSNKVIVAKVYSPEAKNYKADGTGTSTPEAIDTHGTHVSGTIAGIEGYTDPTGLAQTKLSGVAPKAYLGNYNVFPCDDCSADSIFIAKAVEDAVNDGMDVANLSLGGTATPGLDLLVEIVNAASDAGMTMVIAAGNDGPGPATVGSPGTADKVITVAAVSNSHFFGKSIQATVNGSNRTLPIGSASPGGVVTKEVTAPLAVVTEGNGLGCSEITEDVAGKIAVIKRGSCTFTTKAANAQAKGAQGVLIVNNQPGDPTSPSVETSVTIPVGMVSDVDGTWLSNGTGSATFTPGSDHEFTTPNSNLIAGFSSRGPTINYTLKPDVAAVGVNVYSSTVGGGLGSLNGTSMATPHVAGAAALLLEARPEWGPQDVKSALMATASSPKSALLPVEVGAGVINVSKALNPVAIANPASLSFKQLKKSADGSKTLSVTLKNTSDRNQTYMLKSDSTLLKTSKSYVSLAEGKSATFDVTVSANKEAGDYQGYITITALRGSSIRIPFYYNITE